MMDHDQFNDERLHALAERACDRIAIAIDRELYLCVKERRDPSRLAIMIRWWQLARELRDVVFPESHATTIDY